MEQLTQEGHFTGGCIPFGYRLEHKGRTNKRNQNVGNLVIDPDEAEIVKLIFQKYLCEGYGAQRLCRYLAEQGIQTEKDATYRLLQSTASLRTPFTLESSEMEKANQRCCQSFRSLTLRLMNGRSK